MGIIILPFLLVSIILGIIAIIKTVKQLLNSNIRIKEVFLGVFISLVIFGFICLSYLVEGKAWALSQFFRVPIFMILIPFAISSVLEKSKIKNLPLVYTSKIVHISVGTSLLLGIVFYDLFFNLIDYLGIDTYY